MTDSTAPEAAWAHPWKEVLEYLDVDLAQGLDAKKVGARLKTYGHNRLREAKAVSAWRILLNQVRNLIVAFLAVAAGLSFFFGDYIEGLAIIAVLVLNTLIGFITELKGTRSIEALRKLGDVYCRVRRGGSIQEIPAKHLVPGDIVILEAGDIITADLRLVRASRLRADESVLTGESLPVSKDVEPLQAQTLLAERGNMLFKGTALTHGSGEAVVVATGMETELGQISSLVEQTEEASTPLEERLNHLGYRLLWLCIVSAALAGATGIAFGKSVFLMIETAIALAVAAIPEGLPIVATIALARGVWRMAKRNALIKRLAAVETLGATSVICTDKTGTLTENRLTVTHLALPGAEVTVASDPDQKTDLFSVEGRALDPATQSELTEALEIAALCNNASLGAANGQEQARASGDPLEVALLAAAAKGGVSAEELIQRSPEVREEAFDSEVKMMATFNESAGQYRVAVKGAPEPVIQACTALRTAQGVKPLSPAQKEAWLESNAQLAAQGLRVLALATKTTSDLNEAPYQGLELVGLVGLVDPPRTEVKQALSMCREAGVKIVMVTGDQAVTARNIALAVGLIDQGQDKAVRGANLGQADQLSDKARQELLETAIFARVNPRQKLDIIGLHQDNGSIVAMTGDGVNDAPALKKADIGVAMGQRGTQVAREASDMILQDDSFASIVGAVEQGRIIFGNIRKFVVYLLSCNISEILVVTLATLVNAPLPLLPLQILFLNVVTDVFPALALAAGEGSPGLMQQPPRDGKEPILTRPHWFAVAGYGIFITAATLGALALCLKWLDLTTQEAVTVSFLTLAFAQLWHVFNMRDIQAALLSNDITRNVFVWAALVICALLLLMAVYLPGLATVLKVVDPGPAGWLVVMACSLTPLLMGGLQRRFLRV